MRRLGSSPLALRYFLIFVALLFGLSAVPVFADPPGEAENPYAPSEAQLALLPSAADTDQAITELREGEAELKEQLETPAAEEERAESQEAFASVSASEASAVLREEFPEQLGLLESDPARTLSDAKLDRVFGSEGAQVTVEGEPMLLEGSMPVRATDEEGQLAKVDLDLEHEDGEFVPANPLVDVSLPDEASEGIEIGSGGLVVKPVLPEGESTAHPLGEKNLLYYETAKDTDLLAAPLSGGLELSSVLRSPESPEELRFDVELPTGSQLQADSDGGAEILGNDESTLGIVTPPSAVDSQGASVPVELRIEGGQVVLHVPHREQEFAYPIYVDPYYQLFESWDGDYGSWFSGHNLSALSPGIWNWNTNDGSRMWGQTTPIYHNWGGSERGLYASATNTSSWQSGGINGQWTYEVPGNSTYIVQAGITPFPRDNHGCGATQYTIPMDFNGIWSPSQNRYVTFHLDDSNNSGWSMNAPNFAEGGANTGRILALGLTTWNGGTAIPCWRDIYAGGASVYLDDLESPTLTSVTGAPTGWVNGSKELSIQAWATDNGLGVKNIKVVTEGPPIRLVPEQSECSGLKQNTCLSSAGGAIKFTGAVFPEGESTATVVATDPTQKISNAYPWTMKVDRTSPELSLSGQLATITNEAGAKEHAGDEKEKEPAEDDELSLPSYQLTIKATEGDATKKRSGVKNIEIYFDKKTTPETVPWSAQECKTYSCSMEKTYTLNLTKLTPGPHILNVVAVDQVGNKTTPERKIEFEYTPATGLKDEYVLHHIPLPDGKDHSKEEESDGSELAVNVINGNLVYHEQDLESEANDLQLERFYNSQLPDEENTEWGDGWTLAAAPDLDIESGSSGKGPIASVLGKTGSVDHSVGLPGELTEPTFDPKLQATIAKAPGGGYEVTGEKTGGVSLYSGEGQILESRPAATGTEEFPPKPTIGATTLCKTNAQRPECLTDDRYRAGAAIAATATEAKFETSLGNVTCTSSALGAETSTEAGEPLPARITSWSLVSCTLGATSCTASAQNIPVSASLKATTAGNGELKVGSGSKAPGWALKCGTTLECTLSFEPAFTVEGGSTPRLIASKKTMSRAGAKCPTEAKFSSTYTLSTPKPLYLEGLGFPAGEPILRYSYSGKNLIKIAQAERGVEVRPAIDLQLSSGLVASATGAAGSSSYAYTSGQLTSAQSPEGKTTFEYDASGRLVKIKLPNETTATIAYEVTYSRVTSIKVDPAGPEGIQTTTFAYSDNPRETTVTPPSVPAISYKIGADGSVFKWQAVKQPPAFDSIAGTLWEKRNTTTPIAAGDQTFSAVAKAIEGVPMVSIQLIKDGNQLVAEKECTDDPETKANECVAPLTLKWVTSTASMAPGYANFEVIAADGLGQTVSERFTDYIPVTPPPTPGVPVDPSYGPTLEFREEFGLDIDLKGNEEAIEARVWKSLANWELGDPVARASMDEWGVPLFPADVAELEYRERYVAADGPIIQQWGEANYPSTYAGYYVDHSAGGVIRVGFTSNQESSVAQLKSVQGIVAPSRFSGFSQSPTYSRAALISAEHAIASNLESSEAWGGVITDMGIDDATNKVTAGATNVAQAESLIAGGLGGSAAAVAVHYEPGGFEELSGRNRESGRMLAGDRIFSISANQQCTAGFGVYEDRNKHGTTDKVRAHLILTAGHCIPLDLYAERSQYSGKESEKVFGRVGQVTRSGYVTGNWRTDAETINAEDRLVPHAIYRPSGPPLLVDGEDIAQVGEMLCFSGVTTGEIRCKKVLKHEVVVSKNKHFSQTVYVVRFGADEGDSGGPVWNRETHAAVGIIEGRPNAGSSLTYVTPLLQMPHESIARAPGALKAPGMYELTVIRGS